MKEKLSNFYTNIGAVISITLEKNVSILLKVKLSL